jgi:hypothetical protein
MNTEIITLDLFSALWLRAPILTAGAAAAVLSHRAPGLRPVGVGLLLALACDAARALAAPPYEVAVALAAAPSAIGGWVSLRALAPRAPRPAAACAAAYALLVLLVPAPAEPPVGVCLAAALGALLAARRLADLHPRAPAEECALALVLGDVLGAFGPAGPIPWPGEWASSGWLTAAQASVASSGVLAVLWKSSRLRD